MAFSDLLAYEHGGVGWVWLVEVSFDDFSTISYRWSTSSYHDGTNQYDGRIMELGTVTRSLGADGFPVAGTTELTIDNTDFAADWLVDHSTWTTYVPSARFRLKLGLFYADGAYTTSVALTTQQMGEFVCLDFPSRDASMVRVSLADDSLGRLADLALAPSINDWLADGDTTTANCPLKDTTPSKLGSWDAPTQLAFGSAPVRCNPVTGGYRAMPGAGSLVFPIIVCATTDTDASGDVARSLVGQIREDVSAGVQWRGRTIGIPATFVDDGGTTRTIWSQQRTAAISKDGKTWRLIWLQFDAEQYVSWGKYALSAQAPEDPGSDFGSVPQLVDPALGSSILSSPPTDNQKQAPWAWMAFECFWFSGYPLSARTNEAFHQTGPDVIRDLISYYSTGASASDIDTTSFDEVKDALGPYFVGGVVGGEAGRSAARGVGGLERVGAAYGQNKLREVLAEILASIDADLSITWLGKYQLTALNTTFDAITATRTTIDETRIAEVEERTPSLGERWSPYNRVYVEDRHGDTLGPFDHPTAAAISSGWKRLFSRTLQAGWVVDSNMQNFWGGVWLRRLIEARHRSAITFRTDIYALNLDLGDYFEMQWTRLQGGSTPYSSGTIWRVESVTIDPREMSVIIGAVWMGDLTSENPYLLDDETLIDVATGSGGRTLGVVNADQTITFSSGSLITDGVEAGDILIVRSSANAADDFTSNYATRITAVTDATHLEVVYSSWTTESGISSWTIEKGATTYPDSTSDPTNYPDDGAMYGKASSDSDLFSDSTAANYLKDG